jgi:hypothetical protein
LLHLLPAVLLLLLLLLLMAEGSGQGGGRSSDTAALVPEGPNEIDRGRAVNVIGIAEDGDVAEQSPWLLLLFNGTSAEYDRDMRFDCRDRIAGAEMRMLLRLL